MSTTPTALTAPPGASAPLAALSLPLRRSLAGCSFGRAGIRSDTSGDCCIEDGCLRTAEGGTDHGYYLSYPCCQRGADVAGLGEHLRSITHPRTDGICKVCGGLSSERRRRVTDEDQRGSTRNVRAQHTTHYRAYTSPTPPLTTAHHRRLTMHTVRYEYVGLDPNKNPYFVHEDDASTFLYITDSGEYWMIGEQVSFEPSHHPPHTTHHPPPPPPPPPRPRPRPPRPPPPTNNPRQRHHQRCRYEVRPLPIHVHTKPYHPSWNLLHPCPLPQPPNPNTPGRTHEWLVVRRCGVEGEMPGALSPT